MSVASDLAAQAGRQQRDFPHQTDVRGEIVAYCGLNHGWRRGYPLYPESVTSIRTLEWKRLTLHGLASAYRGTS